MSISFAHALRITTPPCIAFTGAGGKTTAMFMLARELGSPVIVTATTHLGKWQIKLADTHIIANTPAALEDVEHNPGEVILVTDELDGDRVKPVNGQVLDALRHICSRLSLPMLIEADGARQKPLKAWAEHEPPMPRFVEQVVHVVGLSGLWKPLAEDHVHRSGIFSKLSGLNTGEMIKPDAVLRVLMHPNGAIKNVPENARMIIALNQADTLELQAMANGMSQELLAKHDSVIVSSLSQGKIHAVHEPIAGIVLAAGGSSRFGQPKQLLDWKGQPFVRAVAKTALDAGLSPVIVLTGANAEQVEGAIRDLNVRITRNENWESGQASSIKAGIRACQGRVGGAIFLLVDQPQVTGSVLRALVEKHAEGLHPIVAPMVMDRRANPVLFDRATFDDLLSIEGDVGGRAIFHKYRVEYLPWHDDRLLLDVDTPAMYQRLVSDDTL